MTRISAAVMGIEFAYAAETAFVSPTLLKIGKSRLLGFHIQIEILHQPLSRRPSRAYDSHLVSFAANWVLSDADLRFIVGSLPLQFGQA